MKASLLSLLVVLVLGLLSSSVADAQCGARVRKSYDRLTIAEKTLYRRALAKAMDTGLYIKFVEMHTERRSEMEAHRVCMFTYWHRYFLLGFENMLRSLGPEYACITVPYWDQMQQNARAMTGACSNLQTCAPVVSDWGGSAVGLTKSVIINGVSVPGFICATGYPLSHFCQSSSAWASKSCVGCLPRDNLTAKAFPAMANYASVYRQLFTAADFVSTSKSIEDGMHNSIHATLGATMGTFQSPADPLFWSHHAYVDLLLTIFLKCRAGLGKLSDTDKANNPATFVSCPHREDTGLFTTTSTVTMRNGENGANPIQTNAVGSPLYEFFKDVPDHYVALSDITTLGATNRYNYMIGGLVGQLGVYCTQAPNARRLKAQHNGDDDGTFTEKKVGCHSGLDNTEAAPTQMDATFLVDTNDDHDVDAAKVNAWVNEVTDKLAKLPEDKSRAPVAHPEIVEMERMVCMFYDQCRGGVVDYSDEFKKAFGVTTPPPCKVIVDEIKGSECKQLRLPDWKETMEKYFPCTLPVSSANNGAYGVTTQLGGDDGLLGDKGE